MKIEIDNNGWKMGWHNVRQFFWFAKRKAFRKAIHHMFQFENCDGYVYMHIWMIQIYFYWKNKL